MPDESRAEGDGQYCKVLEVEGLAIDFDHTHVSRVSNGGFVKEPIVNNVIDQISHLAVICQYPHRQSLDRPQDEDQLHSRSPWGGILVQCRHGGSSTCSGDPP